MRSIFISNSNLCLLIGILSMISINCTNNSQRNSDDFNTEKNELASKIDSRIDSLNNDLERLREKGNEAGENVSVDFRVKLNELEEERQRLQEQKQIVSNASEDEWEETKNQVIPELEEIEKEINQEVKILENEFQE